MYNFERFHPTLTTFLIQPYISLNTLYETINVTMSAFKILSRVPVVGSVGSSCPSLRLARNSSLNLFLRSNVPSPQVASQSSVRYISQANKEKVNERNEAIRRNQTVGERVKKVIQDQLGVKAEEVCTFCFVSNVPCRAVATVDNHLLTSRSTRSLTPQVLSTISARTASISWSL